MASSGTLRAQWIHAVLTVVALAVATSSVLGVIGQWLSISILLLSLPPLFRPQLAAVTRLFRSRFQHPCVLPVLVFTLVLVLLLGELLLGHPPASRDHAIHYFQTSALVRELLPAGSLHGWSSSLNNGIVIGEHYPILGYLWTGAANLVSGGVIDLRASYALGIFAVWAVACGGIFLLAHTLFSALGTRDTPDLRHTRAAAWAGCLAATLWLLDEGYSREGGWHYLMFHGVWPQLLSTALWTLSLAAALRMWQAPSPRRIALTSMCLAGSLLAHPFGLLTGATSMGLLPAIAWLTDRRPVSPRSLLAWGLSLLLSALLCAGWLVIFFDHASTLGRTPVPWASFGQLSSELLTGELFHDQRAIVGPLALLGALVAVFHTRVATWWIVATTVALLLLGSTAAITVLRLDLIVAGFKNLQFVRYAIAIKPLWYALAGVGAMVLARGLRPFARRVRSTWKLHRQQLRTRVGLAVLAGPLLWGGYHGCGHIVARPVGGLHTLASSHHGADEAALKNLLAQQLAHRKRPLKVAFLRRHMGGGLYPLFTLADLDIPVVLDGHVPTINSVYTVDHRRPELLRELGVTHILYDRPLANHDQELSDMSTPVGTAGPYTLAAFDPPEDPPPLRSNRIAGELRWRTRGGEAKRVAADSDVLAAWELRGFGKNAYTMESLWAPISGLSWQFTRVGDSEPRSVEHSSAEMIRGGVTGMRMQLVGDGRLELLRPPKPRHLSMGRMSTVAWLIALVCIFFANTWNTTPSERPAWLRRLSLGIAVSAVIVLVVVLLNRQQSLLVRTWEAEPVFATQKTFVRDLVIAGDYRVTRTPPTICDGMLGRDSRRGCSRDDQATQVEMLYRKPFLYRCVQVTIPAQGRAEISFLNLDTHALRGVVARDTGMGGHGRNMYWRPSGDDRWRTLGIQKHVFETPAGEGPFGVEVENRSLRDQKVCAAAAAVDTPPPDP